MFPLGPAGVTGDWRMLMISVPAGGQRNNFEDPNFHCFSLFLTTCLRFSLLSQPFVSRFVTSALSNGSTVGVEVMPVLTSGSVARFRDQVRT